MKKVNFDISITKQQAKFLADGLYDEILNFSIMCKEYGQDDDWVGMTFGDDFEDEEYNTFEIWLGTADRQKVETVLNHIKDALNLIQ